MAVSGEGLEKFEDMIVRAAETTSAHVRAAKAGIGAITKHLIPMMTVTFIVVLIVTYIPATTKVILWLFNMR